MQQIHLFPSSQEKEKIKTYATKAVQTDKLTRQSMKSLMDAGAMTREAMKELMDGDSGRLR